jgi:DNA-binding transcriptional ArsR family regulator
VSVSDEEPYSTIFASLNHPVRRKILRMLSQKPMSFSEILEALGVSSSFLTYHVENLGELVSKTDGGKYRLSSFGEAAIATMTRVEDIPITVRQQEGKSRRFAARSAVLALGIVCILLICVLGGAMLYYTRAINDRDNEVNSLKATINQLNTTIAELNSRISQLESNLTNQIQTVNVNWLHIPFDSQYLQHGPVLLGPVLLGLIVTVVNGTVPISGAMVSVSDVLENLTGYTDAHGMITFSVQAQPYPVEVVMTFENITMTKTIWVQSFQSLTFDFSIK